MHFTFDAVATAYQSDNAGVSLVDARRCEHDHPAFAVTFPGRWIGETHAAGLPDPLTVITARCTATHMVGAFIAFLLGTEGTEAADAFMQEVHQVAHELTPVVHHIHTTGQGCCEAAFRTRGREHTCRRDQH
ncbi:hypothetical protein [Streptomyces sp. NPDC020951]|uniref:hypothetical protein n=1 Tax=Streptomyces sp. NPDC020951 TaxID=3365104 RepID=UPI0037B7308B